MLLVDDFLDPLPILEELRRANGAPASVYGAASGGRVEFAVRKTTRIEAPVAIKELVLQKLEAYKPEIEKHFDIPLGACEEPQFLKYDVGDYFVAHQDGNTPLLLLDKQQNRRISIVIFLSGEHEGGELVMHTRDGRHAIQARPGRLVAFRSETTHEVTPVTRGERYTIAAFWSAAALPPL